MTFRTAACLFSVLIGLGLPGVIHCQIETSEEPAEDPAYENIRLLTSVIQLIRQDYIEEQKTDYNRLVQSALRGMLSELDPHSQFLDESAFRAMQEETKSEFGGLGIQVGLRGGMLTIISPIEGGPAFEAGLMPEDRILKIDGKTTDRLTLPEAVELLRGEVGGKITLTIQNATSGEIKDYTLQRAIIKIKSVRDVRLLPTELSGDFKVGYVRISQFSEPTAKEFEAALDQLEADGAQGIILDLRFNPGGLLTSAIDVAAQFLPPDQMVVSTTSRLGSRPFFPSDSASKNRKIPLIILINSASASGAEIVAGALKDLGRALLIGETTFGKGSVQSVNAMLDGSAVRLTTAKYLTPGEQPIHEVGISPHIRSVLSQEQERQLLRAWRDSERMRLDGTYSWEFEQDTQLRRAAEVFRGLLKKQAAAENES